MNRRKPITSRSRRQSARPFVLRSERSSSASYVVLLVLTGVVATVVLTAHWPALSAKALAIDDNEYLTRNELVQHPGWASARRFLGEVLSPSTVRGYYQPLTMISLMADYAMGGRPDNLRPFHRTSLVLHVLNTSLIILLLYMLFGRPWVAAIVGLLFGVHPLTVEPIPWVSERKTLLAAFFALWSLVFYVRYARRGGRWTYGLCLATYVFALLAKPTATTLPLAMLLMDFWPLRRLSKRTLLEKVPFLIVGGASAAVTFLSQAGVAGAHLPGEYGRGRIPLILCHNIILYLYKIMWPVRLSSYYPFPEPLALSDGMVLAGVIGTCLLVPALLISLFRTRAFLTGWLFFFVVIFPTMGVIGFTVVIAANKYAYLPFVGLLMVLAWALGQLWDRPPKLRFSRSGTVAATFVVASALVWATRAQLSHWRTTEGLYEYMLTLAPNAADLHYNLGLTLADEGRLPEAIEHYNEALRLRPRMEDLDTNLGNALARLRRFDEATVHFERALQAKRDDPKAYNNMGNVLSDQFKLDQAIEYYRRALELNPRFAEAHNNMAVALAARGSRDEAARHYTRAIEICPEFAAAHSNLGLLLAAQGKADEAIEHYTLAVRSNPEFAEAHINLGQVLAKRGNLDEAIQHYTQALRTRPNDPKTHNGLGLVLTRVGRTSEAIRHYREALRLYPGYADAQRNLDSALQTQPPGAGKSPP